MNHDSGGNGIARGKISPKEQNYFSSSINMGWCLLQFITVITKKLCQPKLSPNIFFQHSNVKFLREAHGNSFAI